MNKVTTYLLLLFFYFYQTNIIAMELFDSQIKDRSKWALRIATIINKYFEAPYSDEENTPLLYNNMPIYRPNHALAHGIRQGYLSIDIIYLLLQFPNFTNIDGLKIRGWVSVQLQEDEFFLRKVQFASSFQRSGRQSEISSNNNPHKYQEYIKKDQANFYENAKNWDLFLDNNEIDRYRESLGNVDLGNLKRKFLSKLFLAAHYLDLRRIINFNELEVINNLSQIFFNMNYVSLKTNSPEQVFLKILWAQSGCYLNKTGDRDLASHPIRNNFNLKIFAEQALNPQKMISAMEESANLFFFNNTIIKRKKYIKFSEKEIGEMFFAVHLRFEPPENFVLKGKKSSINNTILASIKSIKDEPRGGIFWSLGSGIHNHPGAIFDNRKYGIVVAFEELYGQLLNVNPMDMFTIGDFDLKKTKKSYIFAPKDSVLMNNSTDKNIEIIYYEGVLRDAISSFMIKQGKSLVHLHQKIDKEFSFKNCAFWNCININDPLFFSDILKNRDYLSYGNEGIAQVQGEGILIQIRFIGNNVRFIKDAITNWENENNRVGKFKIGPTVIMLELMYNNLTTLFKNQTHPLSPFCSKILSQLKKSKKYINMMRMDLLFRKKYGFHLADIYPYLAKIKKNKINGKRILEDHELQLIFLSKLRNKCDIDKAEGFYEENLFDDTSIYCMIKYLPIQLVNDFFSDIDMEKESLLWKNFYWFDRYLYRDYGCNYGDSVSTRQQELIHFQETLADVFKYKQIYGRDCTYLNYLQMVWGVGIDETVCSKDVKDNRLKIYCVTSMLENIIETKKISITFLNEIRTFDLNIIMEKKLFEGIKEFCHNNKIDWNSENDYVNINIDQNSPFLKYN